MAKPHRNGAQRGVPCHHAGYRPTHGLCSGRFFAALRMTCFSASFVCARARTNAGSASLSIQRSITCQRANVQTCQQRRKRLRVDQENIECPTGNIQRRSSERQEPRKYPSLPSRRGHRPLWRSRPAQDDTEREAVPDVFSSLLPSTFLVGHSILDVFFFALCPSSPLPLCPFEPLPL